MHGGCSELYDIQMSMHFTDHWIHIHIDREQTILPVVHNYFMSDHYNQLIGPQMRLSLFHTLTSELYIFGDLCFINNLLYHGLSVNDATFDNELEY